MKNILTLLLSALLFIATTSATIPNASDVTASRSTAASQAFLSARYPLNYLGYSGQKMLTTFKKGITSGQLVVAYLFEPQPGKPGYYNATLYFAYGESRYDCSFWVAPTGGITLSGNITIAGHTVSFSDTIPGGEYYHTVSLPVAGYPQLSNLSVSPTTYIGDWIFPYALN